MPRTALARAVVIFSLGLSVLAAGMGIRLWSRGGESGLSLTGSPSGSGAALVGGPFRLTDHRGQVRTAAEFHGRYMLVYFGYTFCPDVCPTTLLAMTQALDLLAERDRAAAEEVAPIFITIDPERDDVETLAAYAPNFHESLIALTGTAEEIAAAAKAYRVFYAKHEDPSGGDYLMDHSSFIYLMGPDGGYLTHFSHAARAEEIVQGLHEAMRSPATLSKR